MILLASALIAAGSALVSGYFVAQRKKNRKDEAPVANPNTPPKATEKAIELPDFPCQLGDVILRRVGDEAWLEGAIVLSEDAPVCALFVAPEGRALRGVFVRPRPALDVFWLAQVPKESFLMGREPPTSAEYEGQRYERTRRLPLRARRVGVGAPDAGENVLCAEYTGPGPERLVVIAGDGGTLVWAGEALFEGMYDVLASGKSTL